MIVTEPVCLSQGCGPFICLCQGQGREHQGAGLDHLGLRSTRNAVHEDTVSDFQPFLGGAR